MVDGSRARALSGELRCLAPRCGAEIGDAFARDIAEKARRQSGSGVLYPPLAIGETWEILDGTVLGLDGNDPASW